MPLNPNGNDPKFPKKEDGSRDLDTEWTINHTWEQMEAVLEKGLVKAIGVSKCARVPLRNLSRYCLLSSWCPTAASPSRSSMSC